MTCCGYDRENQGRSVVFAFRYAQEGLVKRAPEARASWGVWEHAPPEICYF